MILRFVSMRRMMREAGKHTVISLPLMYTNRCVKNQYIVILDFYYRI